MRDDVLWFLNTRVQILKSSAGGADGLCVQEHRMPYGDSPPLHVHERQDEIFHVLEGRIRFKVGEDEVVAGPGDSLVGPKGVPHSFRVESEDGARMLVMSVGHDFETFVRSFGRPGEGEALPPLAEPTPAQQAELGRLAAANRIEILGPPMASVG